MTLIANKVFSVVVKLSIKNKVAKIKKETKKQRRTLQEIKQEVGPVALFVREKRNYLGYTQEIFAKRIGVGLRFIKELELGKQTLRMDKVNEVLRYLGAKLMPMPYREED